MKSTKSVKTLARDCLKLQEKIIKDIHDIRGAEQALDRWDEEYTRLPSDLEEARARLVECQAAVGAALEALSKPLDEYRYDRQPYHRRYSSEVAQKAWDETRQAEHAADHLALMEIEAAKSLEEYTKLAREGLAAAWQTWHDHNTLLGAKAARIRAILKRDVLDLSELARTTKKQKEEESPSCKLHHIEGPDVRVCAKELYKAAREVGKGCPKKTSLPILTHILVRVTDDGLKLFTRNLDEEKARVKTVNTWANGTRWETCVPARTFTDWLGVMAPDDDILTMSFLPSVQVLQIKTQTSRTEFRCLDAQEFPPC